MSKQLLKLPGFKGLITNADLEDIPHEAVTVLKNMQPVHGKMVRTFGLGNHFSERESLPDTWGDDLVWKDNLFWIDDTLVTDLGEPFDNVIVYENSNVDACPLASGTGFLIIAYLVDETSGQVTLKYWDGDSWEDINSTGLFQGAFGNYHHRKGRNPVIIHSEVLRLLPGKIGMIGEQPADTIWCGFIQRSFFDERYKAGDEYSAGFFDYPATIERPDIGLDGLNPALTVLDGGSFGVDGDEIYYYKISYIYDGVSESLLSDAMQASFTEDTFLQMAFATFDARYWNKRITAIKVYRSNTEETGYNLIHTLDLTRKYSAHISTGHVDSLKEKIYVPDLADHDFGDGYPALVRIRIKKPDDSFLDFPLLGGDDNPTGTGNTLFATLPDQTCDLWDDYPWYLETNTGLPLAEWVNVDEGSGPVRHGEQLVFLLEEDDLGQVNYAGGILVIPNSMNPAGYFPFEIERSGGRVIKIPGIANHDLNNDNWKNWGAYWSYLYSVDVGLYEYGSFDGYSINLRFFDTKLPIGASHQNQDEVSIKVNSEFALYNQGRLFQYNVILDPDNKAEVHPDWLTYSDLNQLDVTPMSNVIMPPDRSGGEGTGLALAFGAIILMKKMALYRLNVNDPGDPATWSIKEANFSRGNVAKKGFVQVGETLYVCSHDGIYAIDLNVLAAADETPMLHNRISEDINNLYLAITNKADIVAGYDPLHSEIVYQFDRDSKYAFNILEKSWREIQTNVVFDLITNDHEGNLLVVDNSQQSIFSPAAKENSGFQLRTKSFLLSHERGQIVRYVKVHYQSSDGLLLNLYVDDDTSVPVKSEVLPAQSLAGWKGVALRYRCKSFQLEIMSQMLSKSDTEIYQIIVEHD